MAEQQKPDLYFAGIKWWYIGIRDLPCGCHSLLALYGQQEGSEDYRAGLMTIEKSRLTVNRDGRIESKIVPDDEMAYGDDTYSTWKEAMHASVLAAASLLAKYNQGEPGSRH